MDKVRQEIQQQQTRAMILTNKTQQQHPLEN